MVLGNTPTLSRRRCCRLAYQAKCVILKEKRVDIPFQLMTDQHHHLYDQALSKVVRRQHHRVQPKQVQGVTFVLFLDRVGTQVDLRTPRHKTQGYEFPQRSLRSATTLQRAWPHAKGYHLQEPGNAASAH